ncbi:hypothetical protein RND81_07G026000 [Saponaria officinalis]|uniref:Large ribosomal subunit protein bL25 beta domain-containing protein n=1 Tax=Saponaria officinalis TaxID=3572 RepID=A0AAW1JLG3_SAPOF
MNHWWRTTVNKVAYTAAMSRNYHTIQAIPRELSGPQISARDRAQGRIPAVVMLTTESKQIQSLLKDVRPEFFCSTTFKLHVGAGPGLQLSLTPEMSFQLRDPETGKVLNMVFAWADEGSHLEVYVPVVFKGEDTCPGLQKGGQLKSIRTSLKYLCPAESIPQKIEVDVSNLDIGDKILLKDIQVDSTLKLLSRNDTKPICKIVALEVETSEPLQA